MAFEKIISHTGYIVESSSKYDNLVHNKIINAQKVIEYKSKTNRKFNRKVNLTLVEIID